MRHQVPQFPLVYDSLTPYTVHVYNHNALLSRKFIRTGRRKLLSDTTLTFSIYELNMQSIDLKIKLVVALT